MAVIVRTPNPRESTPKSYDADDMDVDETGTLTLSRGDGRDEEIVAVFAAGAWLAAERQ